MFVFLYVFPVLTDIQLTSLPESTFSSSLPLRGGTLSRTSYTLHDPIFIRNNTDLVYQASLNGWNGNGSESNPYVIEGLNITSSIINPLEIQTLISI